MDRLDFIDLLIGIDFPQRYWAYCDRHAPATVVTFNRAEARTAFEVAGVSPVKAVSNRIFEFERETINGIAWKATLLGQRHGLDLWFDGERSGEFFGGTLAVLASEAAERVGPPLARDRFGKLAPYPRSELGSLHDFPLIIGGFVDLVRAMKDALRGGGQPRPR